MSTNLRPLSLGELLDRTFTYYREHFWTFVGIMVPAEIVPIAVSLVLQALMGNATNHLATRGMPNPTDVLAMVAPLYGAAAIGLLVSSMAHTVALAASSSAVSKFHLGRSTTIGEAYRSLCGSVGGLAGLFGLFVLITLGAYLLLLVGVVLSGALAVFLSRVLGAAGVALSVLLAIVMIIAAIAGVVLVFVLLLRFSLSVPALILERLGPVRALGRSNFLAKGFVGRIFLACVLMYLIIMVVGFTFQAPFWVAGLVMGFKITHNPLWLSTPSVIAGGIGAALSYPILMIVLPLFYYEARVRKEGFDLQVMMSEAAEGVPGLETGMSPAPPSL